MYADPKHLKDHEIKLRVDEATFRAIDALSELHHTQRAVFVRELVLAGLAKMVEAEEHEARVA
jgi:hypothetical protein